MWPASSRQEMRLSGARFFEISPSIGIVRDTPESSSASHQLTISPDVRSNRLSCQRHLIPPLSAIACQESSLHGLGHWQRWFKINVEKAIDDFLACSPHLDPRLATYARSARCGCVL